MERYTIACGEECRSLRSNGIFQFGCFANTFIIPTGPTAHLPPVPPLRDSLIYRAFGLTFRAGRVRALLIIVTTSVLYGMLPWFSERLGAGRPAGVIGGLVGALWALLPGYGEYLTGLILGLALGVFFRRWKGQSGGWSGRRNVGWRSHCAGRPSTPCGPCHPPQTRQGWRFMPITVTCPPSIKRGSCSIGQVRILNPVERTSPRTLERASLPPHGGAVVPPGSSSPSSSRVYGPIQSTSGLVGFAAG